MPDRNVCDEVVFEWWRKTRASPVPRDTRVTFAIFHLTFKKENLLSIHVFDSYPIHHRRKLQGKK